MSGTKTRDEAAKALAQLCDRVPKAYADWSYQQVIAFKTAVPKARRVSKNGKASLASIREQMRAIALFRGRDEVQP